MDPTSTEIVGRAPWRIGRRLGGGGFGQIFLARPPDTAEWRFVAKFVPKEPSAFRELLFQDLGDARNVMPVLDTAETSDHYVLVMPLAERSLQDHLSASGPLSPEQAVPIAIDIATALVDLSGTVVHRDLKPANILLWEGCWRLTDFGISRYAEATTSPETRKYSMSPPYAAPEQWRLQRATAQTDVYALGITLYEMLAGRRPFLGPEPDDFRRQHLGSAAHSLPTLSRVLQSLIMECLFKAPQARPSPAELLRRLSAVLVPIRPHAEELVDGNHRVVRAQALRDRVEASMAEEHDRRAELFDAALQTFARLRDALTTAVADLAPRAVRDDSAEAFIVKLGEARLKLTSPAPHSDAFPHFDVIATATIGVSTAASSESHSLWFCDHSHPGRYSWNEFAFNGLMELRPDRPFWMTPSEMAARAFSDSVEYAIASSYVDIEHAIADFLARWTGKLGALATVGHGEPGHD